MIIRGQQLNAQNNVSEPYIGSANFSEADHSRNIEAGVLIIMLVKISNGMGYIV